jgi:hypothetical protein
MIMLSAMGFEPKTRTLRVERRLILTTHPHNADTLKALLLTVGLATQDLLSGPGFCLLFFLFKIYDFVSDFKIIILFSKNIKILAEFT